ncbi:MAG TPA: hypothetical protein VG247_19620 [Pseudonocardiaceae bacterium]|nr:hypothetical protein [Pseudonocardiaceae bacterium]
MLGRGGAGKSTLARRLGERTGIPVVELDTVFWQEGLVARTTAEWTAIQQELIAEPKWIMDGDLGPYDVVDVRLRTADTVIVLDFSLARCVWRALCRSRERLDFWRWVIGYRRTSLPPLRAAIARCSPDATVHVLRDPRATARFLASLPETR